MATTVTYAQATRTSRMNAVKDKIDAGAGAGTLKIYTAGYATLLATFTCDDPCGSVTNDVLTFAGFPKTVVAAGTGTAAAAKIFDSDSNEILNGTVDTSNAFVIVDNTSITSGQNVTCNSITLTHAT